MKRVETNVNTVGQPSLQYARDVADPDPRPDGDKPVEEATPTSRVPGTIKVGSIAGSDVLVTPSWFLIAAVIAWVMAPQIDAVEPGLGWLTYVAGFAFAIVLYGAVLALTAMTSARVNVVTTLGGAFFLLSDSMLALRMFWPEAIGTVVVDPWQDFAIMLTYCLGEGLIAYGVLRAMAGSGRNAAPAALASEPT